MIQRDKLTELVAGVQRGSEQAVTEMYQACHQELYYYIYKTVNHTELAEDLTQETFMEILQSIHTLQEPAAFVTWSRQIAYRRCTAYFKKRHDFLLDEQEDGSTVLDTLEEERTEFIPGEALDQEELKQMIQDMIQALPEEQRTAIMMRYFDELSVGEIAAVQGVSEGTVKSRLNYGRKAIGQAVQDYEKKNGVKLHCVGVVPLLLWLLRKQCLAKGTIGTAATATTATTAAATVGSTLLSAKLSAVVASLVAAAVGIGGMLYAVRTTQNPEESNTLLQTEQPQFPHTPDPIFITAADARIFDAITEETYASMAADLIGLQQYGEESMTCTPVGAL
ncbi:MAG: RNA polymerase sigma factor, partial [Clostridia bacterium]|nr:RNA polymerase sigma factor [Clostridia bacterium]